MSVPDRRQRRRKEGRSSLQILEEAFHLLRTVDVKYYGWFYLGTVPFAVAMLFFVADMSRSSLASESVLVSSLVMVAFYFWMRWCQSRFAAGLWETISPGQLPQLSATGRFRRTAALFLIQALNLPLLLVGLTFAIPLGWILATLQNATVLAGSHDFGRRPLRELFETSLRHSHYQWAQNHGVLLVLCIVGLFTWVNLVSTCLIVPSFAKSFFGIESLFTISPMAAVLNTTFFLGSLLLTWLVLSPMLKAAYVLRCFYAESRLTGADLLSRLAACREARLRDPEGSGISATSRAAAVAWVAVGVFLLAPGGAMAQSSATEEASGESVAAASPSREKPPAPGLASPERFRASIDETLEQKKYQWQLSRRDLVDAEGEKEKNWLARRIHDLAEATRKAFRSLGDWIKEMIEKLNEKERPRSKVDPDSNFAFFDGLSSTMSIALVALVLALVTWLVVVVYRRYRGAPPVEIDDATDGGAIDLKSEDIVASQLPEGEWMRLAREQISRGDRRLAIRALFLATLAHLGERDLLRIAKYKSNRDYRLELERRVRRESSLLSAFEANTVTFERAWYGWHEIGEDTVERFLRNHETIAEATDRLAKRHLAETAAGTSH